MDDEKDNYDFNKPFKPGQSPHQISDAGKIESGLLGKGTPVGVWSDGTDHRQNPSGRPPSSDSFYDVESRRPGGRRSSQQITISHPGSIADKARLVPVLVCVNGEYKTGGFLGHMTQ